MSKDRKAKWARKETLGPMDSWVLRDSRESLDYQVSMVSAENAVQPTTSIGVPWWRAVLAEVFG